MGRVEEVRKGVKLKEKMKKVLDRRYGLVEKGALAVCTLLKGMIRSGTVRFRALLGKGLLIDNNLFKQPVSTVQGAWWNCQ